MKNYDGLKYSGGVHTIKVTLQNMSYKGSFTCKLRKDCMGMSVLDFYVDYFDNNEIAKWKKENCTIERQGDENYLNVTLTNPKTKDTLDIKVEDEEFKRLIVGVYIVDFKSE